MEFTIDDQVAGRNFAFAGKAATILDCPASPPSPPPSPPQPLPPCRGHDRIDYNSYGRTGDTGFPVGSAVKARFQSGDHWRLGTVEKVHTDGKLDVRYEDGGHLETNVPVDRVRGVQPQPLTLTLTPPLPQTPTPTLTPALALTLTLTPYPSP